MATCRIGQLLVVGWGFCGVAAAACARGRSGALTQADSAAINRTRRVVAPRLSFDVMTFPALLMPYGPASARPAISMRRMIPQMRWREAERRNPLIQSRMRSVAVQGRSGNSGAMSIGMDRRALLLGAAAAGLTLWAGDARAARLARPLARRAVGGQMADQITGFQHCGWGINPPG